MNSLIKASFVVLSFVVAAHIFGQGAGKATFKEFTVTKKTDTVLAFPPTFRGGVTVAAGDVDGDGMEAILKAARKGQRTQGTFTLTFQGQTTMPSAAPMRTSNNLKQIGLAAHNYAEMRIGFLKPAGEGEAVEFATFKVYDVTLKRGVVGSKPADGLETMTIAFTGLEFAPAAIGSANGGIWKTTNF